MLALITLTITITDDRLCC